MVAKLGKAGKVALKSSLGALNKIKAKPDGYHDYISPLPYSGTGVACHVHTIGGRTIRETSQLWYGTGNCGNVFHLSPYIRRRIITEQDVIGTTLGHHLLNASEKFIQEQKANQ